MNNHKYKVNDLVTIQHDNHSFNVRIVGFENSSTAIGYCTKPIDNNHNLRHSRFTFYGTHWTPECRITGITKTGITKMTNLFDDNLFEV